MDRPPEQSDGAASGRGRRTGLVAVVSLAVVAALGVGAYAMVQFFDGGSSPATAVPGSAIGYVSLDLDPSASQKIEAIKIMRKFPALKDELKIGSRDDLRRRIFDEIRKDSHCKSLDYDQDVKPWIGQRIAVAAVPEENDAIKPLVTLQVSDQDKAKAAVKKLEGCDSEDDFKSSAGVAFSGDYLLLTDTQEHADAMAKAADSTPLADDDDFKLWTGRTGDPGIISMYAAPTAVKVLSDAAKSHRRDLGTGVLPGQQNDQLEKAFKGFQGAAGVIRFNDGAVEAEVVSKGLAGGLPSGSGSGADVETLPATTAALLSVSLPHGWLDKYVDQIKRAVGAQAYDQALREGEARTGLSLPDDLETLLGDGFSVSVDSSADLSKLTSSPDPADVPAGIRIKGHPDQIEPIIEKLKAAAGDQGGIVKVDSSGDFVAVGTDPDYVAKLLKKGDLGAQSSFEKVVPAAGRASSVLFVDFDAGGGWATRLADQLSGGNPDVKANVEPLDAFGHQRLGRRRQGPARAAAAPHRLTHR